MPNDVDRWQPSYRGEPRPGNRTFALAQKAIDNGWNPAGRNKLLSYKFYFFIDEQFIECEVESFRDYPITIRRTVHDFIFDKKFIKALGGKERYRKLITGAVLSRSPVDYLYRETIDRKAKIGRRI